MADDQQRTFKDEHGDLHALIDKFKHVSVETKADDQQGTSKDEEGIKLHTLEPDYVTPSEMNALINQFKHADDRNVKKLSTTAARKIKEKLIARGHWGDDSAGGRCLCLNSRLNADNITLAEAGIGRASILNFFESLKNIFDMWTRTRDRSDTVLPMPDEALVVQSSGHLTGISKSIRYKRLSEIATTIDLRDNEAMTAAFDVPSHTIVDNNLVRIMLYTKLLHEPHLKARYEKYTSNNIKSRNHFINATGYSKHVISLLRAPAKLAERMPERKKWSMWRETMILVTGKLLIYRIEWGGAESCPIYSHFESNYIGYQRGNVDWFICNVLTSSQVWVPDLVIYQIGLFGFLQGVDSPYRLDLKAYVETVVSSYAHKPILKM